MEGGVAKGVMVVDKLARADVLDDVADGAAATWRDPEPVVGGDGFEVAEEGVPFGAVEGAVEEVEDLGDGGGCCGWCHGVYYTAMWGICPVIFGLGRGRRVE